MIRDPESALYPPVAEWLARYLQDRFRRATVIARDTHNIQLSSFLRSEHLHTLIEGCDAWEIQVDVTGLVRNDSEIRLAFVECKTAPITLIDVGQLLGYSLVAKPEWSLLISPEGMSDNLNTLLVTYGRQDILGYAKDRAIRLATWNTARREIDAATLIPKGSHI